MPTIEWNESLSVCNEELDSQHKKLIGLFNELHHSLVAGTTTEVSGTKAKTLDGILDYVLQHFKFEEHYMETIQYPDLENHRKAHRELARKVRAYHDDLREGHVVLGNSIIKFLRNWIIDHITHMDKQYAGFKPADCNK